ncbi:MAG: rhomboid family intramembrane serine protease, partial [Phycisphaerae bacterium]
IWRFGMVPARLTDPDRPIRWTSQYLEIHPFWGPRLVRRVREAPPAAVPVWATLLTSMFLHGGWMHFLGNMLFLYIFGDNVEDRLGHAGYLAFYLATGVAAGLGHWITNIHSTVPTIGASGAIAGVMGAYFLLYPRAMILTLVPLFYFAHVVALPAVVFLGLWFVLQLLHGTMALTAMATAGTAWWAHVAGFAVGAGLIWLLRDAGLLRPPLARAIRASRAFSHYRVR